MNRLVPPCFVVLALFAAACAPQRPVLYPNDRVQRVGEAAAQADVDGCIALVKERGSYVSGAAGGAARDAAEAAAVGGAAGAAAGAVYGNAGKGAAAGAAGGAAGGFVRGMLRGDRRDPDPATRKYVERCLRDQGYEVMGWR